MSKQLKWGILSTAKIAREKVIPGMKKSKANEVYAIASRDSSKAKEYSEVLDIPKYYGSYEALINDPEIDCIYNPLPNHLHVEWTSKAVQAGKHVLCEKPLFLNSKDAASLIRLRDLHQVQVAEAFMIKSHPQWKKAKELVDAGKLGDPHIFTGAFSYYNIDPSNIRNIAKYGGGALWDIGCYPVMASRFIFGENPTQVIASINFDPQFETDMLSGIMMEYSHGKKALFYASTQAAPYQRVHIHGSKGELEILIPFNAPDDRQMKLKLNKGDILLVGTEEQHIPVCNQYQLEIEDFGKAVTNGTEVPVTLEDARDHALILNALFKSMKTRHWMTVDGS